MNKIISSLFLNIFLLTTLSSVGQRKYSYNAPGQDCYCEFVFDYKSDAKGVILQNTKGVSLDTFLNSNDPFRAEFPEYSIFTIQIINPGNTSESRCFDLVSKWSLKNHKINPNVVFDIETWNLSTKENVLNTGIETSFWEQLDEGLYQVILDSLDQLTLDKPYKINPSETLAASNSAKAISNSSKDLDISISITPTALLGNPFKIDRGAITMYGLGISKKIGSRHSIGLSAEASFKSPNKRGIEMAIRSDARDAVIFGDDSLFIDEKIRGHTLYSFQLGYEYFFSENSKFKFYVSSGLGLTRSTAISGEVVESVDMSEIDTFDSSSFQESVDLDPTVDRLRLLRYHGTIECGFEYRITPVTKFELSAPIRGYFDESLNYSGNMSMGLNFGLSFTINSK